MLSHPSFLQAQTLASAAVVIGVLILFAWRFARGGLWLAVFAAVFLADQACKAALVPALQGHPPRVLLGGNLWLVYAENHLQGFGSASGWLFALTLCTLPMMLHLQRRLRQLGYRMSSLAEIALGATMGGLGAIACDRLAVGYVIDFIQFGPAGAFIYNPADLAVIGAGVLVMARAVQLTANGGLRRLAVSVEQQ